MQKIKTTVDRDLFSYIEEEVWPVYAKNDRAHDINHIRTVLLRAFELNEVCGIGQNPNEIFTAVSYHDICCYIDRKKHEILSADYFKNDDYTQKFFDEEQSNRIFLAIREHRASLGREPSNRLGKLISSADRTLDVGELMNRLWQYAFSPYNSSLIALIQNGFRVCRKKFGKEGYAVKQSFFDDGKYAHFIEEMQLLTDDLWSFSKKYQEVNCNNIAKEFMAGRLGL